MVAVLFLVGRGLERPSIVDELLDVVKHPVPLAPSSTLQQPAAPWTHSHSHARRHTRTRTRMHMHSQARPNYEIAPDGPLLLYDIGYEDVAWEYGAHAAEELTRDWGHAQETLVLRSAMLHAKRASLLRAAASAAPDGTPAATPASPQKGPGHVPLLERPTAATVEMVHAQAAERAGRKKRAAAGDSKTAEAT
jgi:hypothetical protein